MKINFKKLLLQIYFILFILLNIIDFANLFNLFGNFGSDLDFFKKLLSWSLIAYIFYKVSLTKIFIGERIKKYDILLIISYCFMTITKSFLLYAQNNSANKFYIFRFLFKIIPTEKSTDIVFYNFIISLTLITIISIILLKNYKYKQNSLLGSFNLSEYVKFLKLDYLLLIIISIFFSLIVFNFFMEWFALSVDSLILVIGLIYYILKYIHNHSFGKTTKYLNDISNTGNNFLKNIIKQFSNKKTLFIGVGVLLTIHLLVDLGVYLVPYTIGIENSLYSINTNSSEINNHQALFNLKNFQNSNFAKDYQKLKNEYFIFFIIATIYILSLFFFYFLMFMPFYIFYKNFNDEKIKIKNIIGTLFLSILIFNIISLTIPLIPNPISFGLYDTGNILGINIYTNNLTKNININNYENIIFTILSLFFILILSFGFISFRYEKYKVYFNKIIYLTILIFFISYISIFYYSTISWEIKNIKTDFLSSNNIKINEQDFSNLKLIYQNSIKLENYITEKNTDYNLIATPFSILNLKDKSHIDYMYLNLSNIDKSKKYELNQDLNLFLNSNQYNLETNKFQKDNVEIFYKIGENQFQIEKNQIKITTKEYFRNFLKNLFKKNITKQPSFTLYNFTQNSIKYIRLIFASIFYLFGIVHFSIYYFKKNIIENKE